MDNWYTIEPQQPTTGFTIFTGAYTGTTARTDSLKAWKNVPGVNPINFTVKQDPTSLFSYPVEIYLYEQGIHEKETIPKRIIEAKVTSSNNVTVGNVIGTYEASKIETVTTASASSTYTSSQNVLNLGSISIKMSAETTSSYSYLISGETTYSIEQGSTRINGSGSSVLINDGFWKKTNIPVGGPLNPNEKIKIRITVTYTRLDINFNNYQEYQVSGNTTVAITKVGNQNANIDVFDDGIHGGALPAKIGNLVDVMFNGNYETKNVRSVVSGKTGKGTFLSEFPKPIYGETVEEVSKDGNLTFKWPVVFSEDIPITSATITIEYDGSPYYRDKQEGLTIPTSWGIKANNLNIYIYNSENILISSGSTEATLTGITLTRFSDGAIEPFPRQKTIELNTSLNPEDIYAIKVFFTLAVTVSYDSNTGGNTGNTQTPTDRSPVEYNTTDLGGPSTITTAVIPSTNVDTNTLESWDYQINKASLNVDELEELFDNMTQIIEDESGNYEPMESYNQ